MLPPDPASSPVTVVKASKAVLSVLTALPFVLPFVTQRIPSHKKDIQNIGMELCVLEHGMLGLLDGKPIYPSWGSSEA